MLTLATHSAYSTFAQYDSSSLAFLTSGASTSSVVTTRTTHGLSSAAMEIGKMPQPQTEKSSSNHNGDSTSSSNHFLNSSKSISPSCNSDAFRASDMGSEHRESVTILRRSCPASPPPARSPGPQWLQRRPAAG